MQLPQKILAGLQQQSSVREVCKVFTEALGEKTSATIDGSEDSRIFETIMSVEGEEFRLRVEDVADGVKVSMKRQHKDAPGAEKRAKKKSKKVMKSNNEKKQVAEDPEGGESGKNTTNGSQMVNKDTKLSKTEEKLKKAKDEMIVFLKILSSNGWRVGERGPKNLRLRMEREKNGSSNDGEECMILDGCKTCNHRKVVVFELNETNNNVPDSEGVGCMQCMERLTEDAYFDQTRSLLRKMMIDLMIRSESLTVDIARLKIEGANTITVLDAVELQVEKQTEQGRRAASERRINNIRLLEPCCRIMLRDGGKNAKLTVDYQVIDGNSVRDVHGRAGVRLEKFFEKVVNIVGPREATGKMVKPLFPKTR